MKDRGDGPHDGRVFRDEHRVGMAKRVALAQALAAFWRSLKDGNDRFERTHSIPKPTLGDKGYAFR